MKRLQDELAHGNLGGKTKQSSDSLAPPVTDADGINQEKGSKQIVPFVK